LFALNDRYIGAQLFLRCWPFVNGQGRLVDRLFSRLSFDQKLETVLTTDGFTMTVDPNDLIGRHIYLTGKFDRTVFGVLSKFARPGDTLLDIGANIGYVCGCFLQNVPQSKVIAVEPQPIIVNQLTSNLQQFGDGRYSVYPLALSDSDGKANFYISPSNKGASRLATERDSSQCVVDVLSGPSFVRASKCDPDLIKIDVEGHEKDVLSSLLPALRRLPRAIIYEDQRQTTSLRSLLRGFGYKVFAISKKLTRNVLVEIDSEGDCAANDYLAVRNVN